MQNVHSFLARAATLSLVLAGMATVAPASASTFTTLHSFALSDGILPQGHLFYDYINSQAVVVGAAEAGGSGNAGTLFQYNIKTSVFSDLYAFLGSPDGQTPMGGVTVDLNKNGPLGQIVGTTSNGGTKFDGTLYRIPLNGSYTSVYSFGQSANASNVNSPLDGTSPFGTLAEATDYNFYGTTSGGGAGASGTIFRYSPANNSVSTIYTFANNPNVLDGATPLEGLTLAPNGRLYGTTSAGGRYGEGTIYSITTSGTLTTLYSFTGGNDGAAPQCLVAIDANGNLYGTATQGGAAGYGTLWEFKANSQSANAFTLLHTFNAASQGQTPDSGVAIGANGVLYGTTSVGGSSGAGTIYSLNPSANTSFSVLHSFVASTDGSDPEAQLLLAPDGSFYGTAIRGGVNGFGTLFHFSP